MTRSKDRKGRNLFARFIEWFFGRACQPRILFEQFQPKILMSVTWAGGSSGIWNDPNHWLDGATNRLPTAGDDVIINTAAVITVDTTGNPTIKSLTIDSVGVSINLNGHNLTSTNDLEISGTVAHPGTLTLSNSATTSNTLALTLGNINVAVTANTIGKLVVTGSTVAITGKRLCVGTGNNSLGTLRVGDGASITAVATFSNFGGKDQQAAGSTLGGMADVSVNGGGQLYTHGLKAAGRGGAADATTIEVTGDSSYWSDNFSLTIGDGAAADAVYFTADDSAAISTREVLARKQGVGSHVEVWITNNARWDNSNRFVLDGSDVKLNPGEYDHPIIMEIDDARLSSGVFVIGDDLGNASFSSYGGIIDISSDFVVGKGNHGTANFALIGDGTNITAGNVSFASKGGSFLTISGEVLFTVSHNLEAGVLDKDMGTWNSLTISNGAHVIVYEEVILVGGIAPLGAKMSAPSATILTISGDSASMPSTLESNGFVSHDGNQIDILDGGYIHTTQSPSLSHDTRGKIEGISVNGRKSKWKYDEILLAGGWVIGDGLAEGDILTFGSSNTLFAAGDRYIVDGDGYLVSNGTNSVNSFGALSVKGAFDGDAGFAEYVALGTASGISSLLSISNVASIAGCIAPQIVAIPVDANYTSHTYTAGTEFTILTAGTISGTFTLSSYNSYGSTSSAGNYVWGSALPLSMNLPVLADGLRWVLDKVHVSAGTASTDSLVLRVATAKPVIDDVAPVGSPYGVDQHYVLKFTANELAAAGGVPFVVQAEGRVNLQDGNGTHMPSDGATVGNWSTVSGALFSSSPDTAGHYYGTITLQMGSTYNLRVLANTADGGQFASDAYTFAAPLPSNSTSAGFAVTTPYGAGTLPTLTVNAGYNIITDPNAGFPFYHAWARTAGNVFAEQWHNFGGYTGYMPLVTTYFNGAGAATEFLIEWTQGTNSGYATVTNTASADSYATAESNSSYGILGVEFLNAGGGSTYAGRNGTESSWAWGGTPYAPDAGFGNHAGVLSRIGLSNTASTYTKMSTVSYDSSHVTAPDGLLAVAVGDAAGVGLSAINLSWNDQSDNETGFLVERGIFHSSNGTDVTWSTLATVTGSAYRDTMDWGTLSAYGVTYRVSAVNSSTASTVTVLSSAVLWKHFIYTPSNGTVTLTQGSGTLTLRDGGATTAYKVWDVNLLTVDCGTVSASSEVVVFDQRTANISTGLVNLAGAGTLTLQVVDGEMEFGSDAGAWAGNLTVRASSGAEVTFSAGQSLAGLVVDSGAEMTLEAGSVVGTIANAGTLVFDSADSIWVLGAYTGTGGLDHEGDGEVTLLGAASYSGVTTIATGTLVFGGGEAHSVAGVVGSGTLMVAAETALESDGVVMAGGSWVVEGLQVIRNSTGGNGGGAYVMYAGGSASTALSGTCIAASLTFGLEGVLDLGNNGLILQAADSTSKATMIAAIAGTVVEGVQVVSATAATASGVLAMVVADNGHMGASYFGGLTVDSNSILVTQALIADGNFDGYVNSADRILWSSHFGSSGVYSVRYGDFNNDGLVNSGDLPLWNTHFGNHL